jgi:4a-hydroxytetrahydrobiopterin dehydratase
VARHFSNGANVTTLPHVRFVKHALFRRKPVALLSAHAMRTQLSDLEIQRALGGLPGWARKGSALHKTYSFARFADGIRFVGDVSKLADGMNHHPDIDVRYTKVTFSLSTHDAGGITQADLDLAKAIEGAAGFGRKTGG